MVEEAGTFRKRAKAVDELIEEIVALVKRCELANAVVDLKAEGLIVDIAMGECGVEGELHLCF